ncbi:hypothetical protein IWQ56_000634 [Coemansia nantahalensis]|nr:hypothetical protein IWQ56_000634 [Coemansia nantahalensis]
MVVHSAPRGHARFSRGAHTRFSRGAHTRSLGGKQLAVQLLGQLHRLHGNRFVLGSFGQPGLGSKRPPVELLGQLEDFHGNRLALGSRCYIGCGQLLCSHSCGLSGVELLLEHLGPNCSERCHFRGFGQCCCTASRQPLRSLTVGLGNTQLRLQLLDEGECAIRHCRTLGEGRLASRSQLFG